MYRAVAAATPQLHIPRRARPLLWGAYLLLLCCASLWALGQQGAAATLDAGDGLYLGEQDATSAYRWTSSQATWAITPVSQASVATLTLSRTAWPGQQRTPVALGSEAGLLAQVAVGDAPRIIHMLLPAHSRQLVVGSDVTRPPGGDWRWLGVQVRQIEVRGYGLPLERAALAVGLGLAGLLATWAVAWCARRGYGWLAMATLAGLATRLYGVTYSPAMMHRDEVVSMVDAWYLSRTGHDHLGHLLPLASFEAYGDWVSPLLTYVQLPWVAIFGPNPAVVRVAVALFGALAVPAAYGLARELRLPAAAPVAALVAALSPWQVFLSRVAIPPALIPTMFTLLLWAAVRFVRRGGERDALLLALAGGLGVYAYPTMKMAVPLVGLLAVALALRAHGWRAVLRWRAAALLVALWLPFLADTLLNPASGTRLQSVALRAEGPLAWLAAWWAGYSSYFDPRMYYGDGGGIRKIIQAVPGHGLALLAEAPLLLGLALLPVLRGGQRRAVERGRPYALPCFTIILLLLGLALLAPLPASLTKGSPHTFRSAMLGPVYALLVGVGASMWWQVLGRLGPRPLAAGLRWVAAALVGLALLAQGGQWLHTLNTSYALDASDTWFYADGEFDAMRDVVARAPGYDEVWLDIGSMGRPYIFLLAAQPMEPAEVQAQMQIERNPPHVNAITRFGTYRFVNFSLDPSIPSDLPVERASIIRDAKPGYLAQRWEVGGRRILLVRGMKTKLDAGGEEEDVEP